MVIATEWKTFMSSDCRIIKACQKQPFIFTDENGSSLPTKRWASSVTGLGVLTKRISPCKALIII